MKNHILSLFSFLSIYSFSLAQNIPFGHGNCVHQTIDFLGNKETLMSFESELSQISKEWHTSGYIGETRQSMPDENYHIPVVFHIIHNGEEIGNGANLSYERILDQMEQLNFMFSGGNGGVDTEIRFCLAQNTYPSTVQWSVLGEPGVMRYPYAYYQHVISVEHEESLMSLCGNSFGQFPFTNYLNIYIVNSITDSFNNSAVGYSPLPLADEQGNSLTALDGVVIIHPAVGSENFGSQDMYPVYAEGNILCHEIGHYLRLYHTFQTFGTETDCEGSSDDALNSNIVKQMEISYVILLPCHLV